MISDSGLLFGVTLYIVPFSAGGATKKLILSSQGGWQSSFGTAPFTMYFCSMQAFRSSEQ